MNALTRLRTWFDGLAGRERRVVMIGGALAALIVVGGSLWWLEQHTRAAHARIDRKQHDLAFVQAAVAEILAAGPQAAAGAATEPLAVSIDRLARQAGLREAMTGAESAADGSLRATFSTAPFDAIAGMLAQLQLGGASVQSASIQARSEPGRVDATLVLRNPPPPR
ncbi:MAG: type II secretion system protein GspM [Steroidobacteraceae bacterium]